ncbi:FAD/NAD(P)-binding protein [Geodermatophilus sp. SYSU D00758]
MTTAVLPGREPSATAAPADHDLLFVGAGASTSYVLLSLLDTLRAGPRRAPVRIGVVERAPDPFTGVPYGRRAARTSLLITPLRDFLPDPERALFVQWLSANKEWVFDEFVAHGGPLSRRWWSRHRSDVERDEFESLYLPRYTFGEYLRRRTGEAISRAAAAGVAVIEVCRDEVLSIEAADQVYAVGCRDRTLRARRVVLATGSPPVLPRLGAAGRPGTALVDDPFDEMGTAVERIREAVERRPGGRPPHVVLIGGNAGTMDMLYQVNDLAVPRMREAVYTVLSPRGELPERIDDVHVAAPFRAEHLEALQRVDAVDAVSVYEAALADIAHGRASGLTVTDTLRPISEGVGALIRRLPEEQAREFAGRWGVELGRHQRRAGWEYCEVVEQLRAEGRLGLVAGSFVDVVDLDADGVHVRFRRDGVLDRLETPADAVINCGGPGQDLVTGGQPLLAQLVRDGVCRPTPSGAGIAVDPTLAAAPGLYVMGPLLAGNLVNRAPVWHMEHCGRISAFGSALGSDLGRALTSAPA